MREHGKQKMHRSERNGRKLVLFIKGCKQCADGELPKEDELTVKTLDDAEIHKSQ
jgi:hypothetical protein